MIHIRSHEHLHLNTKSFIFSYTAAVGILPLGLIIKNHSVWYKGCCYSHGSLIILWYIFLWQRSQRGDTLLSHLCHLGISKEQASLSPTKTVYLLLQYLSSHNFYQALFKKKVYNFFFCLSTYNPADNANHFCWLFSFSRHIKNSKTNDSDMKKKISPSWSNQKKNMYNMKNPNEENWIIKSKFEEMKGRLMTDIPNNSSTRW